MIGLIRIKFPKSKSLLSEKKLVYLKDVHEWIGIYLVTFK